VSVLRKIQQRKNRRAVRVRASIRACSSLPRVSVHRTLNQIYAQIIDDSVNATMVSFSSLELKNFTGDKTTVAHAVGKELAQRAQAKGIVSAVFDRGSFLYHGRVKALADGLREGGLTI
jgi:large subunit ribosomal protein L18